MRCPFAGMWHAALDAFCCTPYAGRGVEDRQESESKAKKKGPDGRAAVPAFAMLQPIGPKLWSASRAFRQRAPCKQSMRSVFASRFNDGNADLVHTDKVNKIYTND